MHLLRPIKSSGNTSSGASDGKAVTWDEVLLQEVPSLLVWEPDWFKGGLEHPTTPSFPPAVDLRNKKHAPTEQDRQRVML